MSCLCLLRAGCHLQENCCSRVQPAAASGGLWGPGEDSPPVQAQHSTTHPRLRGSTKLTGPHKERLQEEKPYRPLLLHSFHLFYGDGGEGHHIHTALECGWRPQEEALPLMCTHTRTHTDQRRQAEYPKVYKKSVMQPHPEANDCCTELRDRWPHRWFHTDTHPQPAPHPLLRPPHTPAPQTHPWLMYCWPAPLCTSRARPKTQPNTHKRIRPVHSCARLWDCLQTPHTHDGRNCSKMRMRVSRTQAAAWQQLLGTPSLGCSPWGTAPHATPPPHRIHQGQRQETRHSCWQHTDSTASKQQGTPRRRYCKTPHPTKTCAQIPG